MPVALPSRATISTFVALEHPRDLPNKPNTIVLTAQAFLPAQESILAAVTYFNSTDVAFSEDNITYGFAVIDVSHPFFVSICLC